MESVNRKVILIAVILAFITTFLIYAYIKKMTTDKDTKEYNNVYIATKTLLPKHKIAEGDIIQIKVEKERVNSKAVQNKADIIGARTVDRIIEGEQILKERLAADSTMTLSFIIPEGKRAISININEQSNVANLIRPGDYVDVIASFDSTNNKEKNENKEAGAQKNLNENIDDRQTRTILQKVQVLAEGQDQSSGENSIKEIPKTITLALSPEDAEKLTYVSDFATVRLTLRPVGEEGLINKDSTFLKDIIKQ